MKSHVFYIIHRRVASVGDLQGVRVWVYHVISQLLSFGLTDVKKGTISENLLYPHVYDVTY